MARQPLYQRIADDLRRPIESGELPQGGQLPSQLELCDRYEASRNTVRNAIKRLTAFDFGEVPDLQYEQGEE